MIDQALQREQYAFVMNALRRANWPPKNRAILLARTKRATNPATGRLIWFHRCAGCKAEFVRDSIEVDHKLPVVPVTGRTNIQDMAERMLCAVDGFQVLCKPCHAVKTNSENAMRLQFRGVK